MLLLACVQSLLLQASVSVDGARTVDEDFLSRLATKTLEETSDSRAVLNALWALGVFADVQIEQRDSGLRVHVEESPLIRNVVVRGACGSKTLQPALKRGARANGWVLEQDVRALRQKCRDEGFALADATGHYEPVGTGQVDAIFKVEPRAKVKVARVHFPGARAVSVKALATSIQTQRHTLLSYLSGRGTYQPEVAERDAELLRAAYWDRGHLQAEISSPLTLFNEDQSEVSVRFEIREGPVFRLASVQLAGDASALNLSLASKPGAVFRRVEVARDLATLEAHFQDRGHPFPQVVPLTELHEDRHTVSLRFDVSAGPVASIERIEFSGNVRTRDEVLRREMRIAEGEQFTSAATRLSEQRLLATGYFESVQILPSRGANDAEVVLNVRVKERRTGYFNVGAGVSAAGLFGTAQISETNLLGRGQTLSTSAQIGLSQANFRGSFVEPHLLGSSFILGLEAFHDTAAWSRFDRRSRGVSASLGYHLTDQLSAAVSYSFNALGSDAQGSAFYAPAREEGITSSIRAQLTYDTREQPLHPRKGMLHQAFVELATPALGGTYSFARYGGFARFFMPLPLGITLRTNASVGIIQSLSAAQPVPFAERYFLGGINSVRGYEALSLTPVSSVAVESSPDSSMTRLGIGGDKQVQLNLELEIPIPVLVDYGLRGVLFYDAGNVFAPGQRLFGDRSLPLGLYHSVGAGIRWDSPLGPLRFEVGVPLTPRVRDERYRIEFGIGTSF